jgi:hypothetical protein
LDLKNGTYAQELQRPGSTIDSVEVWNGCLKVTYSNASGQGRIAFYDPSTLQHIETLRGQG